MLPGVYNSGLRCILGESPFFKWVHQKQRAKNKKKQTPFNFHLPCLATARVVYNSELMALFLHKWVQLILKLKANFEYVP